MKQVSTTLICNVCMATLILKVDCEDRDYDTVKSTVKEVLIEQLATVTLCCQEPGCKGKYIYHNA